MMMKDAALLLKDEENDDERRSTHKILHNITAERHSKNSKFYKTLLLKDIIHICLAITYGFKNKPAFHSTNLHKNVKSLNPKVLNDFV